jgi:hypothetical protein
MALIMTLWRGLIPDAALEELRQRRSRDDQVALVLACQLGTDDGVGFLARVGAIHPRAKRVVVLRWGDFASRRSVIDALARGDLDRWILHPEYSADEEFHRSITELLEDWRPPVKRSTRRCRSLVSGGHLGGSNSVIS